MPRVQTMGRGWVHSGLAVLALAMAGCAVVPSQDAAGQGAAGPGASSAAAGGDIAQVLARPECRRMAGQRTQLQAVHAGLARAGMALRVLGCPQLPATAGGTQVIAVAVVVVDGERAADTVRGPLADGERLDMGSAAPPAGALQRVSTAQLAQPPRNSLSPDVLFNRDWLRQRMAAQGLRPAGDAWWAFIPR